MLNNIGKAYSEFLTEEERALLHSEAILVKDELIF
ncbi:hypothetical protein SDC9_135386 [bioreactor metagenome]|uniref:Uncharacterized protein n=1 Tax=bioreactor metagenome TaxID=1076179 RepID=A0A645DFP6_9ZZZZ